jgi:hypothetical protein
MEGAITNGHISGLRGVCGIILAQFGLEHIEGEGGA